MSQFVKMQQLLQHLEISFVENIFVLHSPMSFAIMKILMKKNGKIDFNLIKIGKLLVSEMPRKFILPTRCTRVPSYLLMILLRNIRKKQATPHLQYKNDEVNNSDSISEWKCHNCGFNPNACKML
ncbi:hypothetical protein F8M41_004598 [Gigaspora margarita]|uniref:Uncharacterized protein n=1 Tax=Gigaspora margarita TaxID=4874 RepID=A0A8H4AXT1_GIGMA|nr:hypothetical protein F8M41_004598 [Gigaspora margarita]